jgi:phosphoserine phosphatase
MDDIICSELEVINGFMTGRPVGNLCYGKEKLNKIIEYCEKNNSTPPESWYYADAIVDLPALSLVGFPVCINPDRKLSREARRKGWPIFSWS